MERIVSMKKAAGQLGNRDELIVSPTLSDVKGRTVLPDNWVLWVQQVHQLYFIVVLVVVLKAFRELQKDRKMGAFCNSITPRIYLKPPLYTVDLFGVWVDYGLA